MPVVANGMTFNVPTVLECISEARRGVTKESLTSVNDDPVNGVLLRALNEGVADIYFRARWVWRRTGWNIAWSSAATEYPLPGDFHQMATEPRINGVMMREVSPEEWQDSIYQPSWNALGASAGQPGLYMLERNFMRVWPMPSADFVALTPVTTAFYYRKPSERFIMSDAANFGSKAPDIPAELVEALISFMMYKLKIFLQYTDFALEKSRYEEVILNRIHTDVISVHPERVRPVNRYSANFG